MEKQGRERGDKGCVCSWKKGVMGVKKDGRKIVGGGKRMEEDGGKGKGNIQRKRGAS